MPAKFTARQGEFLAFIQSYSERHGAAPSFDDLATHFGVTSPSVNGMIKTLERRGLISRIPGAARTLRVEVPAHELPDIGFGGKASVRLPPPGKAAGASSVAVSAAIAVLDTVVPALLALGADETQAIVLVRDAGGRVYRALKDAGISENEAAGAARRIGAEAARWTRGGVTRPRYVWRRSR
ncbi:MAG: MarR family transcriptional regulator [Acidobacteriota bacterium]